MAEAFVSVKRLQKFLESEEMHGMIKNGMPRTEDNFGSIISVKELTANWPTAKEKCFENKGMSDDEINGMSVKRNGLHNTLSNINVNIRRGSLVGIVGPVGAGKCNKKNQNLLSMCNVLLL